MLRSFVGKSILLRSYSSKVYSFNQIKQLVEVPNSIKVLVDVREPSELKDYTMPTSINIPYKSEPHALSLNEEEFVDKFGFPKPSKDNELIFFCAKGIRAKSAQELATEYGFSHTSVYPGSITEWLEKGGNTIKPK